MLRIVESEFVLESFVTRFFCDADFSRAQYSKLCIVSFLSLTIALSAMGQFGERDPISYTMSKAFLSRNFRDN